MRTARIMRPAFTLLEMMISITILSVIMIFLYASVNTLQDSNRFYGKKVESMVTRQQLMETLYLDFSLLASETYEIVDESKAFHSVLLQTKHSNHHRFMPYVAYIVNDDVLYRLESLDPITLPLNADLDVHVDVLAKVKSFLVYKTATHSLIYLKDMQDRVELLKVRILDEK